MAEDIQVGAVVQLKAGGPKMTVNGIRGGDGVMPPGCECLWFEFDGVRWGGLQSGTFPPEMLQEVPEEGT